MTAYNPGAFGDALHAYRLQLGWSAIQLSELYAEFVGREESPPSPTFIYHIEGGTTLVSQERHAILASLVGMPLVTDLDHEPPLDILEYLQALKRYCDQIYWQQGTLKHEREEILARTNHLERAASLACVARKKRLLALLGFYQIILAEAMRDGPIAIASALLSSTIEIAKAENFSLLHAYARIVRAERAMERFELTSNPDVLQEARRDIQVARKCQERLPALYKGLLQVRCGLLDAYMARDKEAFTAALHLITKGSNSIGEAADDKCIIARLDEEYCLLARASAYLFSPMGNAKLGLTLLSELEREMPDPRGKSRLVQRHQLFTLGLIATGQYPMAVAHLEMAVEHAPSDSLDRLVWLLTRLKDTAFGNNPDVARIAVKVNRMRYPQLFR